MGSARRPESSLKSGMKASLGEERSFHLTFTIFTLPFTLLSSFIDDSFAQKQGLGRTLENLGESWRNLENLGESWKTLENLGNSWRILEILGELKVLVKVR